MLTEFDIYAAAGGKNIAVVREFAVTADKNGRLEIEFVQGTQGSNRNPSIRGIEVIPQ